jgi:hypothetical protein
LVKYGDTPVVFVDANGDPNVPTNGSKYDNGYPSNYMSPFPINSAELVGTFANNSGQIVGTPFAVGNLRTLTVPTGATRLQLGVNDAWYGDDGGSWTIQVSQVPEPGTWSLLALGIGALLGSRRLRRSS